MIKGACEGLGMQTLMNDLGKDIGISLSLDASAAKGILERSGLSKVRHMDVNHLWLQEQCARKLVPLTKVDGTKNPSDLLTKHLTVAVIEKHLEFLNLEFREGRAEKAANLHELSRARRQEESIKGNKIFSFEDGRADSWASRGEGGEWCRSHRTPRRALFTPFKIPRGPGRKTKLKVTGTTEGIDDLGQKFVVKDNWTDQAQAHALRERPWVGCTSFVVDPEEDVNYGGDYRRQRAQVINDYEHTTSSLLPKAGDERRSSRVSWADIDEEL